MVQPETTADDLVIGGFEPFSSVDWPGRLVAVAFLQGCPWRCTYCHNPALQDPKAAQPVTWHAIRTHLSERVGQLDGLVFSGGEPTRQTALVPAMREVRDAGLAVGLHSAGAYPARLAAALPFADWLGLDIKASPERYGAVTGVEAAGERAWSALDLAVAWGGALEVRLTVDPTVHTRLDIVRTLDELEARGAPKPVIQQARAVGTSPDYAARLMGRGLADVVALGDLDGLILRT